MSWKVEPAYYYFSHSYCQIMDCIQQTIYNICGEFTLQIMLNLKHVCSWSYCYFNFDVIKINILHKCIIQDWLGKTRFNNLLLTYPRSDESHASVIST